MILMKREVLCVEEKGFGVGLSLDPRKVVSPDADDWFFLTPLWVCLQNRAWVVSEN